MSEDFGGSDKLTLIVVPDETSKVRRFQLSKKWLKYAMWGAPVLGLALMLVFGDYVRLRLDAVDVDRLSEEARERQVRVDSLAASVGNLEIQLGRIRELERKIRVIADLPDAPEMDPSTLAGAESGASPPQVAPVQPPAPVARPKARTKTVERKAAAKSAPGNTQPTKSLPAKRNPEAAGKARAKPAIELKLRKPAAKPKAPAPKPAPKASSRRSAQPPSASQNLGVPKPGEKPPAHMIIPENQNPPPPRPAAPAAPDLPGFDPERILDPERDAKIEEILGGTGTTEYLASKFSQLAARLTHRELSLEALLKSLRGKSAQLAATPSIWPTKGWVTSAYGPRTSPFTGRRQFHSGLDIAANFGTPILAPADGRVLFVGKRGPMGKTVEIDHGHKIRTVYAHLDEYFVKKGETVTRGQTIAEMGSTGRSTGPHLHYSIKVGGKSVNPANYILD